MSSLTNTSKMKPARVARRRLALSGIIGGLAALVALGFLGSFIFQAGVLAPKAPQDIVSDDVIAKPEQVTSENTSYAGRDSNNQPFEIRAAEGEQDKAAENLINMKTVTGDFKRPSGTTLDIASKQGVFDRKLNELQLTGDVTFNEGQRFKARMDKASVNMTDQTLKSQSPVKVDMQGTKIEADSLTVTQNGTRIQFKGGVKARFNTGPKATGDQQ
jgi:lipopolysaccharide export system protein LptC